MRVLILRPEPAASRMAADLGAHGIAATVAPMLRIVPDPEAAEAVNRIDPAILLFTSAAGVRSVSDGLAEHLRGRPVVTVGPATADAAWEAGFRSVHDAAGDAGALVAAVLARHEPGVGRIVHVAGQDRAGDVAGALRKAGFSVDVVEGYRAETADRVDPETLNVLRSGTYDAAIIASARTAEAFRRCLEASGETARLQLAATPTTLVAISAAAAAPLRPVFRRIVVADRPDGAALTEAVVALASTVANNDRTAPEASGRRTQEEDAGAMVSDNDPNGSDPTARPGRRRGRPTTIDLKAAEVRTVEPDPNRVETSEEAPPAAAAGPMGDEIFVGEPNPASAGGSESSAGIPATPTGGEAPDAAGPADLSLQPPTDAAPVETPAGSPDSIDPNPTSSNGSAMPPPDRPAPVTPREPERARTPVFALLAAGVVGGVISLGGAAALISAGVLPPLGPQPPDRTADIQVAVDRLGDELAALKAAPAPVADPAPVTALTDRLAALETRVSEIPAPTAPPDLEGPLGEVRSGLADVAGRVQALEQRPVPADPAERIETLAATVDTIRREAEASRAALEGLTGALDQERQKIAALEARPEQPPIDPARLDALESASSAAAGRVEAIATELAAVSGRVGAMETATADARSELRSAGEALNRQLAEAVDPLKSDVTALKGAVDPLAAAVPGLDQRLAKAEETLAAAPKEGEIATLSLAVTSLSSKVASGEPFADDLSVLKAAAGELPDVSALEAVAEAGAPTTDELVAGFPLQPILSARPAPPEAGVLDRMLIGAKSIVNYQETGAAATDDLSQPLDALNRALSDGDLSAAQAAWDQLPAYAKERSADWKADLDRKVAADAAVASLTGTVLDRLKAGAGATPAAPVAN